MHNIHVVLDSTANPPAALLEKYKNLHTVALKVTISGEEYSEDEISADRLFKAVKESGAFPRTSQPPIGEFVRVFQRIAGEGGEIIAITVSGALSGTADGARTAARMVEGIGVRVIDSQSTAVGMVRLAECALEMIARGRPAEEIAARLLLSVARTHTLFLTDSLEYLHRGGRIGGAAALFGTILQIKPLLYLRDGKIEVLDKVRTKKKALLRMTEALKRHSALAYIGVVHIAAEAEAIALMETVRAAYPAARVSVTTAGSVLASHLGPGVIGLIYQENFE